MPSIRNVQTIGGVDYAVAEVAGVTGGLTAKAKNHKRVYDVWRLDGGLPSVVDMQSAVVAVAPTSFDGMYPNSIGYNEDGDTGHFLFDVQYDTLTPEALLRWGFDTTGGTVKIYTSKATAKYNASGRTAPDFKSAIGVKVTGKDAEPEGVEIVTPGLKLTAKYKWPKDTIDIAYVKTVAGLTGFTNNAPWYSFAQGELLFLGCSGEIATGVPTEIEYHYLASSNATGLSIGTAITGIAKKGHEYLWVCFEADSDGSAQKLIQQPLGAYVERVYGEADFEEFGIGA